MPQKPFNKLATAIAFSPNMEANISESLRLLDSLGQELLIIHVGDHSDEDERRLQQLIADLGGSMDRIELIWEKGEPTEVLLRVAEEMEVDLLIAGAQPREGLLRYYRGSVARRLVRKSNCSVLLMTNPSKLQSRCGKVVVNGLDHPKTPYTIRKALEVSEHLASREVQIIEEVHSQEVGSRVDDDNSLRRATQMQQNIEAREQGRISALLERIKFGKKLNVVQKVVFGKPGYSISHFAESSCADLLVMNSPDKRLGLLDRVFTHDLEYVLSELPCDLLIIHNTAA